VTGRPDAEERHGGSAEVILHHVDVGGAEAGDVEADEDVVGPCRSVSCFLYGRGTHLVLARGPFPP
jgi:hypothetical protein